MIIIIAVIILLSGCCAAFFIYRNQNGKIRNAEQDMALLQKKIALLYGRTAVNFALYLDTGERRLLVINGKKQDNYSVSGGILGNNLFECPVFTPEIAAQLEEQGEIESTAVSNLYTNLNAGKEASYRVRIKKLENQVYKYIAFAEDITSTVKNIAEKQRFEKLLDFATRRSMVGIAHYNIFTGSGKATDSWYENLCEERSSRITPRYKKIAPEVKERIITYLESLKSGNREPFSIDFEIQTPNGIKWIREDIFIYRVKDKNNIQVIDINFDVTDLKESENILIVLNKQVMEAKKESDKFLNSISHEIRTPLNSVIGFSNLYINSLNPQEKKNFAEVIKMNLNQLIELVNNIIIISKIDSHSVRIIPESIPVNKLLGVLKEEAEQLLREDIAYAGKEITVVCDTPETENLITTDKKMLYQVFFNLLSNALKFTTQGSVTLGYRKTGEIFRFYVKDTGIGIHQKDFDSLFERFEKVDTFTQGTGLGLPLCKSILNYLGGEINVESEPDRGTVFSFTLPQTL